LIRHPYQTRGPLVRHFAPVYYRVRETTVTVVLGDDLLGVSSQLDGQAAGVRVLCSHERTARNRLVSPVDT